MANLTQLTNRVNTILIDAPAEVTNLTSQELDAAQRELEDLYAFRHTVDQFQELLESGDNEIEKPSDWIRSHPYNGPYFVYPSQGAVDGVFTQVQLEWAASVGDVRKMYGSDIFAQGAPKYIVEGGPNVGTPDYDKLYIFPVSDGNAPEGTGDYLVRVPYLKRLAAPSTNPSTETWFMTDADRYLVFKAASELLTMNRDHEEGQLYALKAEREFRRLKFQDKRSRMKSTTLRVQRDANAAFNQQMQRLSP